MKRTTLHIVGGDSRSRAEQARTAFTLGHHAEVYSDLEELLAQPITHGLLVAADDDKRDTAGKIIRKLAEHGRWLPVVITSFDPPVEKVVSAIKSGAIDYLSLPLEIGAFARQLAAIIPEAERYAAARRRQVEAQLRISVLSPRERQVLELLTCGCANKEIGRKLGISSRTVEIHRGNMMGKLGAGHPADAVRLWIEAGLIPELEDSLPDVEIYPDAVAPFDRRVGRMLRQRRLRR